jgi:tetratricopeptide (TPR) repeat protein
MRRFTILILLVVGALFGCVGIPSEIPNNLAPEEYFQKAQESVIERSDYRTALAYYEAYLERYDDNLQLTVEAEYEIAFIYYKLGDYDIAKSKFARILERYRADSAGLLPQWPFVLTNKVLASIEEESSDRVR